MSNLETVIESYEAEEEEVQLCIQKTNPALPVSLAARITNAITTSARKNGFDPYILASVIKTESSFIPNAVSFANARGLMQVRPGTFKEVHSGNIDVIEDNIEAGTRYLRKLIKRFGDYRLALAAYNCGPSRPVDPILRISGKYADRVIGGWYQLTVAGGDAGDRMRPILLASTRW